MYITRSIQSPPAVNRLFVHFDFKSSSSIPSPSSKYNLHSQTRLRLLAQLSSPSLILCITPPNPFNSHEGSEGPHNDARPADALRAPARILCMLYQFIPFL